MDKIAFEYGVRAALEYVLGDRIDKIINRLDEISLKIDKSAAPLVEITGGAEIPGIEDVKKDLVNRLRTGTPAGRPSEDPIVKALMTETKDCPAMPLTNAQDTARNIRSAIAMFESIINAGELEEFIAKHLMAIEGLDPYELNHRTNRPFYENLMPIARKAVSAYGRETKGES